VYVCISVLHVVLQKRAEVTVVELENGEVPRARPGENVNIGLSNVSLNDVQSGFVVCDTENPISCVLEFEAQLAIIDLLPHKSILSAGYSAILHVHTASVEVSINDLLSAIDKKTRQPSKRKPAFGKKGDIVTAVLRAEVTVCLELFSTLQQLGRFTLRDEGRFAVA
jgi:peptide chain release factor subunit 3